MFSIEHLLHELRENENVWFANKQKTLQKKECPFVSQYNLGK